MAVRSREEAIALRNEVLDLWAAGRLAGEIAEAVGIKRGYADVILCKARSAGDPRAAWRESDTAVGPALLSRMHRPVGRQ